MRNLENMIGYKMLRFIEKVIKKIMSSTKNKICFISLCAFIVGSAVTVATVFSVNAARKETGKIGRASCRERV